MIRQSVAAIVLASSLCASSSIVAAEAPAAPRVASPAAAAPVTFGEFTLMYARALGIVLPPKATQEAALEALRAHRAPLPADLDLARTLKHDDLVLLARAARLRISTSTPSRESTKVQAEQFLLDYAPAIRSTLATSTGDRIAAEEKDKDKKNKHDVSPVDPD